MFQCEKCPKNYKQASSLWKHKAAHHSEERHTCEVCNTHFSNRGYLRQHESTHLGPPRYVCQECGQRFVHHSSLSRHYVKHRADMFTWGTCSKTFDRRETLDFFCVDFGVSNRFMDFLGVHPGDFCTLLAGVLLWGTEATGFCFLLGLCSHRRGFFRLMTAIN